MNRLLGFTLVLTLVLAGCAKKETPTTSAPVTPAAQQTTAPDPASVAPTPQSAVPGGAGTMDVQLAETAAGYMSVYARGYTSTNGEAPISFDQFAIQGSSDNEDVIGLADIGLEKCKIVVDEIICKETFSSPLTFVLDEGRVVIKKN